MFNLFDAYVASILNYGSEVWGFTKAENIERVQRKFCKWLLSVKASTNSNALYAEVGRYPMYICRYLRVVKYFLKLFNEKSSNCILSNIIRKQFKEACDNPHSKSWTSNVRKLLQESGFNDVWLYPESVNVNSFIIMFRNRLKDLFISKWRIDVNDSSSLYFYKELKPIFERSIYLDKIENSKFRNIIAKLRLSSHVLFIETGRHQNIPRNERTCTFCTLNEIEDEYHFVLDMSFI